LWQATLLGLAATAWLSAAASAQDARAAAAAQPPSTSSDDPSAPDAASQVQATPVQNEGPTFQVLGVPIRLSAPVPPAYQATSYDDLGGQPMTGLDQVMSQQFTGQEK